MKKKIFMLLALVCTTLTASASAGYDLTVGTNEHGTIAFTVDGNARTYADEGETVTVTVTPNTGYVVNEPSGQWYAAIAAARGVVAQGTDIDLLNDIELTPVEGQENTWTFTMQRANAEISATYKKLLTHTDITIADIDALTYTGQALEPVVRVQDGSTVLRRGLDYTVSYSNNVNAALATDATAPTVTITATATGNYSGTTTKTFTILKADIDDLTEPTAISGLVYNTCDYELVVAGSTSEGTILYSLNGTTWTEYVPTGYDAGVYDVLWKVTGDANHNDVETHVVRVEIIEVPMEEAMKSLFEAINHAYYVLYHRHNMHSEAGDAFFDVIMEAVKLYDLANKLFSEVTSKQIVDMINWLREAEEIYLYEVATEIETVSGNADGNSSRYYDLNGRRVTQPTKGLYIVNGKKVLVGGKR